MNHSSSIYYHGIDTRSCFELQDVLIIKPPKKSPALLRTVVLVFVMVFGVYMCSVCLKQTNTHANRRFLNIEVPQGSCHDHNIDRSQTPYLHYPKPKTFDR